MSISSGFLFLLDDRTRMTGGQRPRRHTLASMLCSPSSPVSTQLMLMMRGTRRKHTGRPGTRLRWRLPALESSDKKLAAAARRAVGHVAVQRATWCLHGRATNHVGAASAGTGCMGLFVAASADNYNRYKRLDAGLGRPAKISVAV